MGEWQLIDTAPEDEPVLIHGYDEYNNRIVTAVAKLKRGVNFYGNKYARWQIFGCEPWEEEEIGFKPTNWMPIPAPPSEAKP